jgi:hypothetical protein
VTRPPNKRVSRGRPVRTAGGGSKNSGCASAIALPVALIAVGVLGLTTHYWAPMLLLAGLPVRQWRAAALTPDRLAPLVRQRDGSPHVGPHAGRAERPVGT